MKKKMIMVIAALLICVGQAYAGIITTADPSVASEIGSRIRWGATGFEASVFDVSPLNQNPTLNPSGSPIWGIDNAYDFAVSFDGVTGTLGLSIDFNRDNSFGAGESISRNTFSAPDLLSYAGMGFNYLSISGNESGSTGRSSITNLNINGTTLSNLVPGGLFVESFYKDSSGNPLTSISITGDITFITAGTGQERPSWNFNFKGPAEPVAAPEPATMLLLGLGLVGLAGARRKFQN